MVDVAQQVVADHAVERLEGEVRVDRAGAVADQQREVMHLARLARLEHDGDLHPQAFADQEVVQAGDREQRRDRRQGPVHTPIGEDQDVHLLLFDQSPGLLTHIF